MGKKQSSAAGSSKKEKADKDDYDDDDEEIDEDEAFNSDDERKYGSFFGSNPYDGTKNNASDDDDVQDDEEEDDDDENNDNDSVESDEEEDGDDDSQNDDGDGGQYMLDLLNRLDDDKNNKHGRRSTPEQQHIVPVGKESQFSASVIAKADVTLHSLMEGLHDAPGYAAVAKTMQSVSHGHAVTAPLAPVVANRTERKLHYSMHSKQVSEWGAAVQENRRAETLDFRPKAAESSGLTTRDKMLDQYEPITEFEKQIHAALQAAGQLDEAAMVQAEEDDLGTNGLTLEDLQTRRGQLAKMRALLFYHEQKRHHINKIKSKKYRRIRKKQRERAKEAELDNDHLEDPDAAARELQEKEEVERITERASLAHKNTSKWAKRVLKRGKNVDVDTRRALSAQLKRGDDLLQRMNSTKRRGNENDDNSDDDDDDEDLIDSARKVLADTDNNDDVDQAKGIFQLAFMQRGIEKQRQRAKDEARQLLMELEANDEEDYRDEENDNDDDDNVKKQPKKKQKVASKEEMKSILGEGDMIASSLKFGTATTVTTTVTIAIDKGFGNDTDKNNDDDQMHTVLGTQKTDQPVSDYYSTFDTRVKTTNGRMSTAMSSKNVTIAASARVDVSLHANGQKQISSNPWMASVAANSDDTKTTTRTNKVLSKGSMRSFVDVDRAVELLESHSDGNNTLIAASLDSVPLREKPIATLTQEELVQRAFMTQADIEIDEEFAKEKAMVDDDENPTRQLKKEKDLSSSQGWGSWAGEGAPLPVQRKLPKKLQAPERKDLKRTRVDAKKPHVIISEKRVKKTADQFMMSTIPYPFTSREEYERSMVGGVGREWNVTDSFKDMTRSAVITRVGKIIQPLSKKVKQKRAPAKF